MRNPRFSSIAVLMALALVSPSRAGAIIPPSVDLDALLKLYIELGLPLPPQDAKLVRYQSYGFRNLAANSQSSNDALGFIVTPGTSSGGPWLFVGFREDERQGLEAKESKPTAAAAKDAFAPDGDVILAIQCHARGWDELARVLLTRSQKEPKEQLPQGWPFIMPGVVNEAGKKPREQLIGSAWDYWKGSITTPEIDRRPIAWRLRQLIALDGKLNTGENKALVRSLDLALLPSAAKPGSIEALIDDLVNYGSPKLSEWAFEDVDHRFWRIAELGLEAVPALIAHLDDERLTRALMPSDGESAEWNVHVRHVVSDILGALAGSEIPRQSLTRQRGYAITKVKAIQWWLRVRRVGEEEYLIRRALRNETDEKDLVRAYQARLLLAKYPKYVPAVYGATADRRLDLTKSLKESWWDAFQALAHVDNKLFNTFLADTIQQLPQYVSEPYCRCEELRYVKLAIGTNDPRVWHVLEQTAKRVELGLRMELLNRLGDPKENRQRKERLLLLASFLNDSTLRDTTSSFQYAGPCAGSNYSKMEVRDFAALLMAGMLAVDVGPSQSRTPDEWARLRRRAQDALDRELHTRGDRKP